MPCAGVWTVHSVERSITLCENEQQLTLQRKLWKEEASLETLSIWPRSKLSVFGRTFKLSGIIWLKLSLSRWVSNYLAVFQIIWTKLSLSRRSSNYLAVFQIIWTKLSLSRRTSNYLAVFQIIWTRLSGYLEQIIWWKLRLSGYLVPNYLVKTTIIWKLIIWPILWLSEMCSILTIPPSMRTFKKS